MDTNPSPRQEKPPVTFDSNLESGIENSTGTEDTNEDTNQSKPNWHKRTISWGKDQVIQTDAGLSSGGSDNGSAGTKKARSTISSKNNDSKEEERDANDVQAEHIQNLFAGAPPRRTKKISSLGNIDLADVIKESPIEHEAETYLLKAIEQREASSHTRKVSALPGTFPQIPDDAISTLSANDNDTDVTNNTAVGDAGPSRLKNYHRNNVHRRNMTMEQQLGGLASAFEAMQTMDDEVATIATRFQKNAYIIPETSNESLQRNATLLFNRGKSIKNLFTKPNNTSDVTPASSVGESPSTAEFSLPSSKRMQSLRNLSAQKENVRNSSLHKKTDGDSSIDQSASEFQEASVDMADIEEQVEGSDLEEKQQDTSMRDDGPRKKVKRNHVVRDLQDFFAPQQTSIALYFRIVFLYISLPLLGIAAILFYFAGCPPTGRLVYGGHQVNGTLWNTAGEKVDADQVSVSWWLVFAVRQIVTFTLAKFVEKIFIDYFTIRSKIIMNVFGPWLTLFILQSKGWPSTAILWAIFNFCLLSGNNEFARHWMFWQDKIGLFSLENPGGNIVSSKWNNQILTIAIVMGTIVSLKRLLLGLYLGRRTFNAYSDQLAKIMQNILMISEVAALGKDFEQEMKIRATRKGVRQSVYVAHMGAERAKLFDIFDEMDNDEVEDMHGGNSVAERSTGRTKVEYIIDTEDRNQWTGQLSYTQKQRIIQLLGAWEEPTIAEKQEEHISVSALLQFRRSMACLNTPIPFGGAFGLADSREKCIQSAQALYRRLLLNEPDQTDLNFETLALLGLKQDGMLDQTKLKDMIRLFRPDRDGTLGVLEFVKSIDTVYKEIRLLRASVLNASKIDKSFETILNWFFYAIAFTITLSVLGYSPMALFLSVSGVILAFAFMIGSASSNYFEGLLLILVRQPYAIGDGIHVMGTESEGMYSGHPFWYVEDVTLFTTSVMYMYTGERATISNGSLAHSRIVNSSRSPQAWMYILLKFPVDVSHDKLQLFNSALEQFFKNRPREWRSFDSFRAFKYDAQGGFIEYMVVATHRNSWYDWVSIHVSKADLIHFCMELSKQLDISYRTPPVPVDLTFKQPQNLQFTPMQAMGSEGTTRSPVSRDASAATQAAMHSDFSHLVSMFPPRL